MSERRNLAVPKNDYHYKMTSGYVEEAPEEGYEHASEKAFEAFRDMKYGVRIHWGLYSMWGLNGESWPFMAMPHEKKQAYANLIRGFNPAGFDAEEWMDLFVRAGMKCFAFTSKHHEGFSLFDTKTRVKRRVNWLAPGGPALEDCDEAYSVMESPFGRDIVRELCDAAHKRGIKIDLYFSNSDWYDADFRPYAYHPVQPPQPDGLQTPGEYDEAIRLQKGTTIYAPAPTPEETQRMLRRHREQLMELLTNYGKIDMICLDQWLGASVWPRLRETIRMIRRVEPDVMLRNRGIGNYADYYTPEGFVPGSKENTQMPWMVIHPLASTFSYDEDESHYKGGGWIVKTLADTVSKGGNLMVGVGPDKNGRWHPRAVADLEEAGAWLRVNGEAIYETRPREGELYREGESIRCTRSKDGGTVYAISLGWPGEKLRLQTVSPSTGSEVFLLGWDTPLRWKALESGGVEVELPDTLRDESLRPCKHAYTLRFRVEKG